jgi:DNA (cytosine-5)-methyltransferase 3A
MSCGQISLRDLGVEYDTYYSSEVDAYAIAQTQLNFPDTVQLGDVERWREWEIDWSGVDLILAGTPCQGFSIAGKGLAFDDPRSKLFFDFVDILNHARAHNPQVKFLLENVKMNKRNLRIITEHVGVFPVFINSALVSAQSRQRWYWTNIRTKRVGLFNELHTDIPQPMDRGIFIEDILEDDEVVDEKFYLSGASLARLLGEEPRINPPKTYAVTQKNFTTGAGYKRTLALVRTDGAPRRNQRKAGCVSGSGGHGSGNHSDMDIVQLNPSTESGGAQPYQQNRVYDASGKSPAHMAEMTFGSYAIAAPHANGERYRRFTPTECARLQTVPAWYRWECSDTQQYKLLGNGWTIEVIKHILAHLFVSSGCTVYYDKYDGRLYEQCAGELMFDIGKKPPCRECAATCAGCVEMAVNFGGLPLEEVAHLIVRPAQLKPEFRKKYLACKQDENEEN